MAYQPAYDTTIETITRVERVPTWHTDFIDWEGFDFMDPRHTSAMTCPEGQRQEWLKEKMALLQQIDDCPEGYVPWITSEDNLIPNMVVRKGMASFWPWWEPRPCVLVPPVVGPNYIFFVDWKRIVHVELRKAERE